MSPGRYPIGHAADFPAGAQRCVSVAGREIAVFHAGGRYCALANRCPHQGAPLCRGTVDGTHLPSRPGEFVWGREGEILRCPRHGWEFDLVTGRALFDSTVRVRTYVIGVEGDTLIVTLGTPVSGREARTVDAGER